jgi:prepilin-type N-terminal cleavage/methylation domain-containing protein
MKKNAFSLVEILVAVAVLALLFTFVVQMVNAVTGATGLSDRGIDAASQSRRVFDQLGMDLRSAVLDPDVDFEVKASAPHDTNFLMFLSRVPSGEPAPAPEGFLNRNVSLVAYRVGSPGNLELPCLLRAGHAVGWSDRGFMGFATPDDSALPPRFTDLGFPVQIRDSDFEVVGSGVVAVLCGFQLYPDNLPVVLANGQTVPNATGQVVYSPPVRGAVGEPGHAYVDASRIASLVVGVAVMDPGRRRLLDAVKFEELAKSFEGLPQVDQFPVDFWAAQTGRLAALPENVPLPVRQSMRLYQRFYPVTPFPKGQSL